MHWFWRAVIAAVASSWVCIPLVILVFAIGGLFKTYEPSPVVAFVIWYGAVILPCQLLTVVMYRLLGKERIDGETRCRRCGYILRGITEPRCPECGEGI